MKPISALLVLAVAVRLPAQGVPTPVTQVGDPIFSMGQPAKIQLHGAVLGVGGFGVDGGGRVLLGAHKAFMNPVAGVIGLTGEAFAEYRDGRAGGLRLLATSRAIGLSAGVEQTLLGDEGLGLAFSWQTAVKRGGIIRHGTQLRFDWMPRGDGFYGVGLTMPIDQKFMGRTRERVTAIRVNHRPETVAPSSRLFDPPTELALTRAKQAAIQIGAFTNLYTPDAERLILTAPTRDYPAVLTSYHANILSAFTTATGDSVLARRLARDGRTIILDAVVMPFNSAFGQAKVGSGIGGLTSAAQRRFDGWVNDSSGLNDDRKRRTTAVFTRWLKMIEELQFDLVQQWRDSRHIWLPMQLGLTESEFDDQNEVDDLIARAVGHPFSDQNALAYLNSTELPLEIARTIFATRDYHVLWTHDFAGRRFSGTIDNIGYSMVADVYLPALTEAVKRYDSTGVMPLYLIMLDQYFYEPNDGRLWMTILEDPLNAKMSAAEDPERIAHLAERQRELRAVVDKSPRLQQQLRLGLDPREVVKVHVNITFPADFSYRSKRIIPPVPFAPDNLMRDHRKIVFYDVNESDPYRGAMILMGVGVGEHYASPTWEDRGYRIRGPAALEARRQLRRTLARLGFPEDKIPLPLRATETSTNAEQQANQRDYIGRALQVHNVPGFGPKESSVARAAMYNLAVPGTTIIVPDPLWLSGTWAGMLTAAAARGSKVMIIAPTQANAPSPQAPLMALNHEVMSRLLVLRRAIEAQKAANAGELRIGLFAGEAQVEDAEGRAREIREGVQRAPWIRTIIPFDSATLAVLENVTTSLPAATPTATRLARDEKPRSPQLHQKTQLIALPGALATLLRQPGWAGALAQSIRLQQAQSAKFTEQLSYTTPDIDTTAMRRNDALLTSYEASRPDAERQRVSFYFSVGTQNMDDRGLASDGEASVIVSGYHAAAGVVDLYNVMARSRWITTQEELDRYVPPPSGFMRWLVRWIKGTL